jgi:hypothetical protein
MKKILTTLGAIGATALLVAGCGGGSSSSSGAATNSAGAASNGPGGAQFQKYTKCLSKHGVDLPSRGRGGNGNFQPPNGGSFPEGATPPNGGSFPQGGPPNGGSLPEGVTPPSGGQGGGFPGLDQSDPKVKKALDACSSLQPSFPGGSGFPGGAPNGSNGSTGSTGSDGSTGSTNGSTTSGQTN